MSVMKAKTYLLFTALYFCQNSQSSLANKFPDLTLPRTGDQGVLGNIRVEAVKRPSRHGAQRVAIMYVVWRRIGNSLRRCSYRFIDARLTALDTLWNFLGLTASLFDGTSRVKKLRLDRPLTTMEKAAGTEHSYAFARYSLPSTR
jgi:hypothetical protein